MCAVAYNVDMTTKETAEYLGVSRRTVQKHLRDIGCEKQGRDYWVTEEIAAELKKRIHDTVGNPAWRVKK